MVGDVVVGVNRVLFENLPREQAIDLLSNFELEREILVAKNLNSDERQVAMYQLDIMCASLLT